LDRLWWLWQMQDPDTRLNAVPMYGTVVPMPDHGGDHGMKGKRQRVTDPNKMLIDLEWLSPITTPLIEAHDQLGSNKGYYCYIYI
jgi:tyrosinase